MKTIYFADEEIHNRAMIILNQSILNHEYVEDYADRCVTLSTETTFNHALQLLYRGGLVNCTDYRIGNWQTKTFQLYYLQYENGNHFV